MKEAKRLKKWLKNRNKKINDYNQLLAKIQKDNEYIGYVAKRRIKLTFEI